MPSNAWNSHSLLKNNIIGHSARWEVPEPGRNSQIDDRSEFEHVSFQYPSTVYHSTVCARLERRRYWYGLPHLSTNSHRYPYIVQFLEFTARSLRYWFDMLHRYPAIISTFCCLRNGEKTDRDRNWSQWHEDSPIYQWKTRYISKWESPMKKRDVGLSSKTLHQDAVPACQSLFTI